MNKLDVLHAALITTLQKTHPLHGHRIDTSIWQSVFSDSAFQAACNKKISAANSSWFKQGPAPASEDYQDLGNRHLDALSRWQNWPSIKAFFYALDAAAELANMENEFLAEVAQEDLLSLLAEVVMDEMKDQVAREYLIP